MTAILLVPQPCLYRGYVIPTSLLVCGIISQGKDMVCYTGSTRTARMQLSQHFNTTLSSTYQYNNKNTEEVK